MKFTNAVRRVKFHHQIYIIFVLTAFWALVVLTAGNIVKTRSSAQEKGLSTMKNVAQTMSGILKMQDQVAREQVSSDFAAVESRIMAMGKPILARGKEVEVKLSSGERAAFHNLLFGYEIVTNDPTVLNDIHDQTGIPVAVYQISQDGRLVCTSAADRMKTSPGTVVSEPDILSSITSQETFLQVVKKDYGRPVLSGYVPLVDGAEEDVIGAVHIQKELLTDRIVSMIQSSHVDGHGFGYIADKGGSVLAHPQKEPGTMLNLENDPSLVSQSVAFAPWDVLVGIAVKRSDLFAGVNRQIMEVAGIGALLVVIPVIIGFVLISLSIRYATRGMSAMAKNIAAGNFESDFDYRANDAIGDTIQAMRDMEAALKEKLGFSQGLLESLTIPCVVTDEQERVVFVNQPAIDLLEWERSPEDIKGMTMGQFFYGDPDKKTVIGKAIKARAPHLGIEVDGRSRKDTPFSISVDAAPVYDQDGRFIAAFVLYTILTEIKDQQKEILAKNERIEKVALSAADISARLASASEEMASQIEQSSLGAEEQQRRAAEVSTAMEQMSASVLEISRNASDAAAGAEKAKHEADKGNQIVQDVVTTMGSINEASQEMQGSLDSLGGEVDGINKVMSIINDIADQTNLLALNAAIEAARAGEAGRGFAVVADEVRKLAEKTMSATSDVGDAVGRITQGTQQNIKDMDKVQEMISRATELVHSTGEAFQAFLTDARENSVRIQNMATAAEEQSSTSEQISQSTGEVNRTAQESSVSMQQAAQAITDLNSLAQELDRIVQDMKAA